MNAVQLLQPSTSSVMKLLLPDKLMCDLSAILNNDVWSDIEIKVQGKSFHCHRIILTARSSYFKKTLRRNRRLSELVEEDGNADAFELVRRYIYTGTVACDQADGKLIANVLSLSAKYNLDELTNFMTDQMPNRINYENAVEVFSIMADLKMSSISEQCLELMKTQTDNCLQTASYIDLRLRHLVRLLKQVDLSGHTQLTLIREWSKNHPGIDAAKLFNMLEEDSDCDDKKVLKSEKQYILTMEYYGKMIILDADTFDEVSTRNEPAMAKSQIAVSGGILYVINTEKGEIHYTPVSGLLKSRPIDWVKCGNFQSSGYTRGHMAVVDGIIYFMDRNNLWEFDATSKMVTQSHEFVNTRSFYSIVELNGTIYGWMDESFHYCDGISGWKPIDLPTSLGEYPINGPLVKMQDSVCLVGGRLDGIHLSSVLCYDTNFKAWTKGSSINQARQQTCLVSLCGERSLLIGGWNGQWMETIELFDQQTQTWRLINSKFKSQFPQAVIFYA